MTVDSGKSPAVPTGQRYASVDALMANEATSAEVRSKLAAFTEETKVVLQLAKLRQRTGMTQEEMGKHLGVNQSAISKLETGGDEQLTLREIREYARATGQRISVMFGKPFTHVEAVKIHAYGIKSHLEQLAALAGQNEELQKDIKGFFSEAFFNILNILAACNEQLPKGGAFEVKFEIVRGDAPALPPKPVRPVVMV